MRGSSLRDKFTTKSCLKLPLYYVSEAARRSVCNVRQCSAGEHGLLVWRVVANHLQVFGWQKEKIL